MNFDLFFGKHWKNTCIVLGLFGPLDGNADKVLSFRVLFNQLRICMYTFCTPETGIVALSEEIDFSRGLNFSNFKNHRRVSVLSIIDHSIELLDKS